VREVNRARPSLGCKALSLGVAAIASAGVVALSTPGAAEGPLSRAPDGRPLVLTFSDDFASLRLWNGKTGVWRTAFRDGGDGGINTRTLKSNGEMEVYVDPQFRGLGLSPFRIHDGVLDIIARPVSADQSQRLDGYRYASGLITTQPSFRQTYGYFEIRARLPAGKGLWPAIWLLPADLSWPPEIDVMESIGNPSQASCTTHSGRQPPHGVEFPVPSPEKFHTFAVSWDASNIICYLDGRETSRQPTPPDFNKPMYLLVNLAVGGGWPGAPDATTPFPARLSIASVRAYRFAG
jgi:beta-glucanase (GH16 family)